MTKVFLDDVVSLEDQTSAVATLNSNSAAIETGFDNTISRDGTAPNTMLASLDMNSQRIINLPQPASATEPVRYAEFTALADDPVLAIVDPGLVTHTGSNIYTSRTLTGTAAEITVTDGSGTSANPTISLPTALTFTGKTVTGGTYSSPTLTSATLTNPTINTLVLTSQININLNSLALGSQPTAETGTTLRTIGANAATSTIELDGYGGNVSILGKHAAGTAASPTASQTNDLLMRMRGIGYGATAYATTSRASVNLAAAENWTDSAHGTYLTVQTTAAGTVIPLERLRVSDTGLVTINQNTTVFASLPGAIVAGTTLRLVGLDATQTRLAMDCYGNIPSITARRSNGTAASPTALLSGDQLFNFSVLGYGATGYTTTNRGFFAFFAGENWTDAAQGSYIVLATTANTTATAATERIRIHGSGGVSIGNTTDPSAGNLSVTGSVKSSHATAGIGYSTGSGGTVTQATNKTTGVTLNTVNGTVVLNNAALAADTTVNFTLTNSAIAATDIVVWQVEAPTAANSASYQVSSIPAAGSANVTFRNISAGSLSEAVVLRFAIIKSVVA